MNNIVREKIDSLSEYTFEGDLGGIASTIKSLQAQIKEHLKDLGFNPSEIQYQEFIETDTVYGYYNEVTTNFEVWLVRPETAEERKKRLAKNKKAREDKKKKKLADAEAERELYEKLKKKYD